MKLDPVTRNDLRAGDILLCRIPELSRQQIFSCVEQLLAGYLSTRRFDATAAAPLIHWVIGYFDRGGYCHASFWNGSKLVESRLTGLRENELSTYSEDTVDVFRYQREGHAVGDACLPVSPLLQRAQALVDLHWPYGFDSGYLLAILCVTRWHRKEWVDRIRDLLLHGTDSPWLEKAIHELFDENRPRIDALVERLVTAALEVVRRYRNRQGMVCSQTVAVIYNEACDGAHPAGSYAIRKPSYSVAAAAPVLLASAGQDEGSREAWEARLRSLRTRLQQLPEPGSLLRAAAAGTGHRGGTEYESWQEELRADSLYTPRDLARSENTRLVGRLQLDLGA